MNEFGTRVLAAEAAALRARSVDVLQVNVGLRCNMSCNHCHQRSGPHRTEEMSEEIRGLVVQVARRLRPDLVDITGGAPELYRGLRELVTGLSEYDLSVQIRSNLTALLEPECAGLIDFLASHRVRVLASLPGTSAEEYATQRGPSFDAAVRALRLLSDAGWGRGGPLRLDIAVNIAGDGPGPSADDWVAEVRRKIEEGLGVPFDSLVLIRNMPLGRFGDALNSADELMSYNAARRAAFNGDTLAGLWCRTGIEVGWDGTLSDCDFNLARGLATSATVPNHIAEFDLDALATRPLNFGEHCFVCAADAGSG